MKPVIRHISGSFISDTIEHKFSIELEDGYYTWTLQDGSTHNRMGMSMSYEEALEAMSIALCIDPTPSIKKRGRPIKEPDIPSRWLECWELWRNAGRAEGHTAALKAYKTCMKGRLGPEGHPPVSEDDLIRATDHYLRTKLQQVESSNFLKLPSTFYGPKRHWEDWIDEPQALKQIKQEDEKKSEVKRITERTQRVLDRFRLLESLWREKHPDELSAPTGRIMKEAGKQIDNNISAPTEWDLELDSEISRPVVAPTSRSTGGMRSLGSFMEEVREERGR